MEGLNILVPHIQSITVNETCTPGPLDSCTHQCTIGWKHMEALDEQELSDIAIRRILQVVEGTINTKGGIQHFARRITRERREQLSTAGLELIRPPSTPPPKSSEAKLSSNAQTK